MKQRNQNPVKGDTVRLKFFVFNGNNYANADSIENVKIYSIDSAPRTEENPLGRSLVDTIESITHDETGKYHIDLYLDPVKYTIGNFQDVWNVVFESGSDTTESPSYFQVFPNRWFTDSMPIINDFSFDYSPNRIAKGSKKYITIQVAPNVARGTTKQKYYETLIAGGDLYITLEQICGDCLPQEQDLRIVADDVLVTERDGCLGYYYVDTTEMDIGIYNLQFKLSLGSSVFVSEKQQIQIFD